MGIETVVDGNFSEEEASSFKRIQGMKERNLMWLGNIAYGASGVLAVAGYAVDKPVSVLIGAGFFILGLYGRKLAKDVSNQTIDWYYSERQQA